MISRPDHFHKLRSDTTRRQTTINSITVQRQMQNSVRFLGQHGLSPGSLRSNFVLHGPVQYQILYPIVPLTSPSHQKSLPDPSSNMEAPLVFPSCDIQQVRRSGSGSDDSYGRLARSTPTTKTTRQIIRCTFRSDARDKKKTQTTIPKPK